MIGVARVDRALCNNLNLNSGGAMSGFRNGEVGGGTLKRGTIFAERLRRMATK